MECLLKSVACADCGGVADMGGEATCIAGKTWVLDELVGGATGETGLAPLACGGEVITAPGCSHDCWTGGDATVG